VREDVSIVGENGWKDRVYNCQEWKKLVRMARNESSHSEHASGMN
jgi:hypothetical protein